MRPAGRIIAAVIARLSLRATLVPSLTRAGVKRICGDRHTVRAPSPRARLMLCRHISDMKRLIQMLPQLGGSVPLRRRLRRHKTDRPSSVACLGVIRPGGWGVGAPGIAQRKLSAGLFETCHLADPVAACAKTAGKQGAGVGTWHGTVRSLTCSDRFVRDRVPCCGRWRSRRSAPAPIFRSPPKTPRHPTCSIASARSTFSRALRSRSTTVRTTSSARSR